MAKKLGSSKNPAVVRVRTLEKAEEILSTCNDDDWEVIVGVEPEDPENVSDFVMLLNRPTPLRHPVKVGRNDPCPCGSGLKYK